LLALGVLYTVLALRAVRRGAEWARDVIKISGAFTFVLSLLQMSLGYFEPVHGVLLFLLLGTYVLGLVGGLPRPSYPLPNLRSDRRWLSGLYGQLLFIGVGASLAGVGSMISFIGATSVFVPEDLAFMGTTASALLDANPDLVPLVAHDRAMFGAALVANGLAILLTALWGFRQGERWLWWALLGAWFPSTVSAFGTHWQVGYTDFMHLLPAALGAAWYFVALIVSYPYLAARAPAAPTGSASEPSPATV
jgi:hypothetical protein